MPVKPLLIHLLFVFASISLVSCSGSSDSHTAQGYIEGRYTYIATSVSGVLKQLMVQRGMQVKQGQILFLLEEQPESDAYKAAVETLKQSIAARDAIAANLTYANITYERYKILVPKNAIERARLDNAKSEYEALLAQFNQATANIAENTATLAKTKWIKDQKIITAPVNAIVFDTYYRIGEYTEANKAILSLLAPADIKAIFYVNEYVMGGLRLGDKVAIQCDGCTKKYAGNISFISPTAEYTPPLIYSKETSYKLVFRIEAAVNPNDAYALHPGQPIIVTFHPRSNPDEAVIPNAF